MGISARHLLLELRADLFGARGGAILFFPPVERFRWFRISLTIIVLFGVLHYIINVRVSKYFVTFETTIWYLWELRLSRECPVREATPSVASGLAVDWQPR